MLGAITFPDRSSRAGRLSGGLVRCYGDWRLDGAVEDKMADTVITTLRLPRSLVDRADALIDRLAEDEEALLLGRVSRSIVLRLAVLRGLENLEAQADNVGAKKSGRSSTKRRR